MRPDPRQRMWTVVRKLPPPVTAGDVEQLADVPTAEAAAFLAHLSAGGWLGARANGFVLLKDHGPVVPDAVCGLGAPLKGARRNARPAHGRAGPLTVLEAVLAALDGVESISLAQAVAKTGLPRRKVLRVLDRLVAEGRLELVKDDRPARVLKKSGPIPREPVYQIVPTASPSARPIRQHANSARDRAWAAMRRLRRFTRTEVSDLCGCHPDVADGMVKLLENYGYLEPAGFQGRRKVLVLVRDPGPIRPRTPQPRRKEEQES